MKRISVSITQRGQITLPAEVRHRFGLKPRDRVVFEIDDDEVRVVRPKMTLEETFGALKARRKPEDYKRGTREAWDEKIDRDSGAGR